jgi:hypothetical protein
VNHGLHTTIRLRNRQPREGANGEVSLTRRLIVLLVLVAASAAVLAVPAAATTTTPPPRPPQPPSAYVQTANYTDGCSDWYLRSISQVGSNLKWVSDCSSTYGDEWYWWVSIDSYYWDAGLQQATLFEGQVYDSDGWYWVCYYGAACQA